MRYQPALPHGLQLQPPDFDGLPSAFDNPGDDAIEVTVLGDQEFAWDVDSIGTTARAAVEAAMALDQVRWRQFRWHPAKALQRMQKSDSLLVIARSPDAVWAPRLLDLDQALVTVGVRAHAVIVEAAPGLPVSSVDHVTTSFPASRALLSYAGSFPHGGARELIGRVREATNAIRAGSMLAGTIPPIVDTSLETEARMGGIPIAAAPSLAGPGGTA